MNALNYALPLAIAALGIFSLIKDWDAHKHVFRRSAVLTLLLAIAVLSIISTHASNKRNSDERRAAVQRDELSRRAIEHLSSDLAAANQKLDFVTHQNDSIISSLKSAPQKAESSTGKSDEWKRRQGILAALRNEYILSHDNLSPGLLAGTEMPPSDWMNKRLHELGEKWSFSNDPKTEARLQLKTLLDKGEDLRKQGCTRLNPQNYHETAPILLTTGFFDWIQNVTAEIEIGEPERLAEWHKAVIWSNETGNALGVECTDFSLKLRTLQAVIEGRATEFSTPEQKARLLPPLS